MIYLILMNVERILIVIILIDQYIAKIFKLNINSIVELL